MRCIPLFFCLAAAGLSQTTPEGDWIYNNKFFDHNNYYRMRLTLKGKTLTGELGGDAFKGTYQDGHIVGVVKPTSGPEGRIDAHMVGADRMEGTAVDSDRHLTFEFIAQRQAPKSSAPKTHTFEPVVFHHFFSAAIEPALHINPGDTVKTWSVDAGGTDAKGVRRTNGGNPLTGPFYIEGAVPGDTLVVHLNRVRLNRDTAGSGDMIVNGALNSDYVERRKRIENYDTTWKLDREAAFASLQNPTEKLKTYRIPLAPMLGCVGVAPGGGMQFRSGFLGGYGGNMDYNQVREGVTIYLRVNAPGALLFVGDGHAQQGAGELTGDALETSMDIEFTVDLKQGGGPGNPRMENADYLMASGIGGSIDESFRGATTNLTRWIEQDYGLNAAEVSSVLSTAIVYDVAEVVDPYSHVVAKIPKSALATLKKVN